MNCCVAVLPVSCNTVTVVTVWHCLTAFCALNCQIIRLDKLFILCDCKALANWVIVVWNQVTQKILQFVQGVGLVQLSHHCTKPGDNEDICQQDTAICSKCETWPTEWSLYETRWHWRHLSARYCTLFKVWDCWMNELKALTKDWSRSNCAVNCGHCPSVFYSILFYSILFYSILFYSNLF